MIVSRIEHTSTTLSRDERLSWRCLARRGMLHAECEAFDYLQLDPGTELALSGVSGTENAWFVVAGAGELNEAHGSRALRAGDLVLSPHPERVRIRASAQGVELLWLALIPRAVSAALPHRRPVA